MKSVLIATTLSLAVLAFPGTASADDDRDRDSRKEYEEDRREAWKDRREAEREYAKELREAEREYWKERREAEREYEKDRREALRERAKDQRRWARGEYLPRQYLGESHYVRDYRAYGLAPPPRGYAYVRPDQDDETLYLVQLASGLVSLIVGD